MITLTFDQLRQANEARALEWRGGGSPLPLSFAMMELAGEAGEACNAAKKLARAEYGITGGSDDVEALARELADVVICADLAARKAGIDLAEWVRRKFNETSDKHGFTTRLGESDIVDADWRDITQPPDHVHIPVHNHSTAV